MKKITSLADLTNQTKLSQYNHHLFLRNLFVFLLVILIPVFATASISLFSIKHAEKEFLQTYGQNLSDNTAKQLDSYFDRHYSFLRGLYSQTNVRRFLLSDGRSSIIHYDFASIEDAISTYMMTDDAIKDIVIYSSFSSQLICASGLRTLEDYYDPDWWRTFYTGSLFGMEFRSAVSKELRSYTSLSLYCQYTGSFALRPGGAMIALHPTSILPRNDTISYHCAFYLEDSDGVRCALYDNLPEDVNHITFSSKLTHDDFTLYVELIPTDFSSSDHSFRNSLLIFCSVCILLAILLSVIFNRRIVTPYNKLASMLVAHAGEEYLVENPKQDSLVSTLRSILSQNSDSIAELDRRAQRLRQMQAFALQAQINPHMLYNTLDSISWSAMEFLGLENDVSKMISLLSASLRYASDGSSFTVSFPTELQHTHEYIELQQIRYENRFSVSLEYDESIMQYSILRMVIQPLLENAIEHGVKKIEHGGQIVVRFRELEKTLIIDILDNGPGIDPEKLNILRTQLASDIIEHNTWHNIGLYNVHRRIQLFYGAEYGISLSSNSGQGTHVCVTIPKEITSNDHKRSAKNERA